MEGNLPVFTMPPGVAALSFDIWKTLLNGNSAFTRPRLRLIFDTLGHHEFDTEKLRALYLKTIDFFNDLAEQDGRDYGMPERLGMMFNLLGLDPPDLSADIISAIQVKVGELRTDPRYSPTLIEPDLPRTLQALQDRGFVLGLLSNTGIDNEEVMEPVLKALGIWDFFQVTVFTSEDGRAKPNPELFRHMAQLLGVEPHQVLHVGDNANADYRATEAGLHAVLYAPNGSSYPHIRSMRELLGNV